MANNKFYGYQPKVKKGAVGVPFGEDLGLVNVNPYEFKKGMDYELTVLGCSRLRESSLEEREKSTEKVLKNLNTHPSYYSGLLHYQAEFRNSTKDKRRPPNFTTWLKEFYEDITKPKEEEVKVSIDDFMNNISLGSGNLSSKERNYIKSRSKSGFSTNTLFSLVRKYKLSNNASEQEKIKLQIEKLIK